MDHILLNNGKQTGVAGNPVVQTSQNFSISLELHCELPPLDNMVVHRNGTKGVVMKEQNITQQVLGSHKNRTSNDIFCGNDIQNVDEQNITFHDITYKVWQYKHCRKIDSKVILNSVRYNRECMSIQFILEISIFLSGELKPGLNAIMGPTGSGKTR